MESAPSKEKNARAIKLTPAHIHPTRRARPITRAMAAGRKSFTSPTAFIARETHSSPPVPATTMTRKRMTSSKLAPLHSCRAAFKACRAALKAARVALPDDQHTQADDSDTQPAQRRNRLA